MTKLQKIATFGTALGTLLAVSPLSVLADTINLIPPAQFNTLNKVTFGGIITFVISVIFTVAGVASFIFLLWGGVQWILAGGDKEGTEKARKRITASLIGLAIVFSAYAISLLLNTIFGIDLTGGLTIPNIGG